LLGLEPDDFDLVVEGSAPELARACAQKWGGTINVHAPFGTAAWLTPEGIEFDFASTRTETYPQPAQLPVVRVPATLAEDVGRRDFTLNSLAISLSPNFGEVFDPFNGQPDLRAGRICVLHPLSFRDDPTRIFRAVRYEQRLNFTITPETLELIPAAPLEQLTADRVRHELELIFVEPNVNAMLTRLEKLGVLARLGLKWPEAAQVDSAVVPHLPLVGWNLSATLEPTALYLALLLRDAAERPAALQKLNPSRAISVAVMEALSLKPTWAKPSQTVAALDELSELGVATAYIAQPALHAELNQYLAHWRHIRPHTTGAQLIEHGLTPGLRFKQILWHLRAAWLDGEVKTAADELALLDVLVKSET
jgi:tRNA nucleotidyltransferase (CCA-adding enzyme)